MAPPDKFWEAWLALVPEDQASWEGQVRSHSHIIAPKPESGVLLSYAACCRPRRHRPPAGSAHLASVCAELQERTTPPL